MIQTKMSGGCSHLSEIHPREYQICKGIKVNLLYNINNSGMCQGHSLKGDHTMLFASNQKGQGLVEYALILVLVAVVVIVILALLGPAIGNIFSNIVNRI